MFAADRENRRSAETVSGSGKGSREKEGYLTASKKRTEIKEILNKMEQAYRMRKGVLGSRSSGWDAMSGMVVLFIIRSLHRFRE